MPSSEQLSAFYPGTYHSFTSKGLILKIRHTLRISRLKKFIRQGDIILDYGCGNGSFLMSAAEALPHNYFWGYEIDSQFQELTLAEGKVKIIKGSPSDLLDVLPQCNLITMNHVVEHLSEPTWMLKKLQEKLIPGGVIEGQTPAANSLERKIFGTYWSGFHAPRHTVIFSSQGLTQMLIQAGFDNIKIQSGFNPAGIAVSLASCFQGNSAGYINRKGFSWLLFLGLATFLTPIDLLSGKPGIIDFSAIKL
jgi:ubiquinone/menaquinone biosynthesis C-methylase UbiE